jgi:hypothetical protein
LHGCDNIVLSETCVCLATLSCQELARLWQHCIVRKFALLWQHCLVKILARLWQHCLVRKLRVLISESGVKRTASIYTSLIYMWLCRCYLVSGIKLEDNSNVDNISGWGPHSSVAKHCLQNCLRGKTIASPELRTVRSHPYTLEWRLSTVHNSRVLAVRHKSHSRGSFKKHLVKYGRSLLQKS